MTIKTSAARPGMYVHAVEGGWMASPFWRKQLVLADARDVTKLVEAGIGEIVIDTDRGVGPLAAHPAPGRAEAPDATSAPGPAEPPRRARRRPLSELDRAREVVEQSRAAMLRLFADARMGHAVDHRALAPLVDSVAASVARDRRALLTVTRLRSKDEYTWLHSVAVGALLIGFARHLGLPEAEVSDLGLAGLLHDIGKMAVPSAVLEKAGTLDPAELAVVRHHPEKGHALLLGGDVPAVVRDVCLHHHERVDGRGYPHGLSGDQLSLAARMSAVCDVYDAVTSQRPYKRPWLPGEALARMQSWHGHLDGELLAAFIDHIGIHPPGALVRLRSNRLAVVVGAAADDPTAPPARAFFDIPSQSRLPLVEVFTDAPGDPILGGERGAYWFGARWPAIRAAVIAADDEAAWPAVEA
ncbi:HD-GYP domain-containing protein [Sphingomonas sp. RHCKR7]|uniref:HD-GYP domain-containing protein n=1 Tax=Sphingomonas folli TaxID=2862497 RepID=UPI001C66FC61|nr:HD-GYP domain-containing protein [Sphingomonas folli]MBW6528240.1 HD-GYP domain-containing protein [Sphingomonas folli]